MLMALMIIMVVTMVMMIVMTMVTMMISPPAAATPEVSRKATANAI